MKKPINEIKKMQRLAGLITESEYQESMMSEAKAKTFTPEEVKAILLKYDVNDEFLEDNDMSLEGGTDPWMDIVSDITGKDAYEAEFTEQDDETVANFESVLNDMGIEVV
jgi:hypothetical protein